MSQSALLLVATVLDSRLWPPQGREPGADPRTDYDRATLTVCTLGSCTTTFYGELHHEPA